MSSAPTALRREGGSTGPERKSSHGRSTRAKVSSGEPSIRGFRPDIEGLRAIAVGTVLLYHAGFPFVHGGFVGVDVFFVISGFLITGLLVAEIEKTGRLSIPGFYARRIKRLLPATVVVLLSTAILSWLYLSPLRRETTSSDLSYSALYSINWRLGGQAVNYLAQGEDPSPVQHFWSLAVEEQFYVVWPVVLLLAGIVVRRRALRLRPTLFVLIAAISIPSFIDSVKLTASAPGAAYFSSFTRAWELGVGAAIAIIAPALLRLPSIAAKALAWSGIVAIVWAAVFYSDSTPFPGHAALLPVLGAGAVIAGGFTAGLGGPVAILGTPLFRHVGRLSYSWYLWHWPLLVIAAAHWGPLGVKRSLLVLAVSYVPTFLTNRYVEDPFRRSAVLVQFPRRAFALGAVCMASVLVAAFLLNASVPASAHLAPGQATGAAALPSAAGTPSVVPSVGTPSGTPTASASPAFPTTPKAELQRPPAFTPSPTSARQDLPLIYADGCQRDEKSVNVSGCVYGDVNGKVTVALLGDSHAAQWFPAFNKLALARHWRLVVTTKSGCNPASVLVYNASLLHRAYTECSTWRANALARLVQEKPALVLVSGSFGNAVIQNGHRLKSGPSLAATRAGLVTTLRTLTAVGAKIVVLRDTPRPGIDVPECVSGAGKDLTKCATPAATAYQLASTGVEQAAVSQVPGATFADLDSDVCPSTPCPPIIGNVLVYRDSDHMTATYAATLYPALARVIAAIL